MDKYHVMLDEFSKLFNKERAKLPYHFNLLDAIGVCETAHSKILERLLMYKSPAGRFEILEIFFDNIKARLPHGDSSFKPCENSCDPFEVKSPIIKRERDHIDILVHDEGYAIIIENKSNGAGDQLAQLSRYIEKVKNKYQYQSEQIFVLYLPPNDTKDPTDEAWGPYKETFKGRYVKLSWREDILPWLKDQVLPNIRYKDWYLVSALEQYIDHWDGRSGFRNIDKEMNSVLSIFIKKLLRWDCDTANTGANLATLSTTLQSVEKYASENPPSEMKHAAAKMISLMRIMGNAAKRDLEYAFWMELKAALEAKGYDEVNPDNLTPESILANYTKKDWSGVGLLIPFKAGKEDRTFKFKIYATQGGGYYGFPVLAKDQEGLWKGICIPCGSRDEQAKLVGRWASDSMPVKVNTGNAWWYGIFHEKKELHFRNMFLCDAARYLRKENRPQFVKRYADLVDDCIRQFVSNSKRSNINA